VIEIIGHERQRRLLAAKPAQSYLFVGPEGVGRRAVARWFAYGLNCAVFRPAASALPAACKSTRTT